MGPVTPEIVAIQKLAQRLAIETANKELAEARLAAQTAEIAELRAELENLAAAAKATNTRKATKKR